MADEGTESFKRPAEGDGDQPAKLPKIDDAASGGGASHFSGNGGSLAAVAQQAYHQPLQGDGSITTMQFQIPNAYVGRLIGKSGIAMRTLQESTQARLKLSRDSETDPRSISRRLVINGTDEQITQALELVCALVDEAAGAADPTAAIEMRFAIPKRFIGLIIGKAGAHIAEIKEKTGVELTVKQETVPTMAMGAAVVARGRPGQILRAQAEIQRRVRPAAEKAQMIDAIISDVVVGVFAVDEAAAPAMARALVGQAYQPQAMAPGLVISVPDAKVGLIIGKQGSIFKQLEKTSGAKIVIPQTSAVPGFREVTVAGSPRSIALAQESIVNLVGPCALRAPDGYGAPPMDPFFGQQITYDMYGQPQYAPRAAAAQGYAPQPYGYGAQGYGQGGDPQQQQMQQQQAMMFQGYPQGAGGFAPPAQSGAPPVLPAVASVKIEGDTQQVTLLVPNEKVGLVIGRGGFTLKGLQMQTGCTVSLPKDSQPGVPHREMVVKGTAAQINLFRTSLYEKTTLLI